MDKNKQEQIWYIAANKKTGEVLSKRCFDWTEGAQEECREFRHFQGIEETQILKVKRKNLPEDFDRIRASDCTW